MDNINFNNQTGKYSFYSVKEKAWHQKGQIASEYQKGEVVLQASGLAFPVAKLPNIHRLPNGDELVSDNSFFTYRTDTNQVLGGKVGGDYKVVQNIEAFEFFDAIAGKDGVFYETAGALGNGERIFITAKLPKYIKVGNDDYIEQYVFLTTSHDGTGSITAALTPIRIVCANTLNAALHNCSNVVKIRHTNGATEKLKEAHKVMGMVNTASPLIEQAFNQFAKVKITDQQVKQLIRMAMASKETLDLLKAGRLDDTSSQFKNVCQDIFSYAALSETQRMETTQGTVFGAYNAVTGYFQNVRKYNDVDHKLNSILYGGNAQLKAQKTFDLCMEFTKRGEDALVLN